jgi:hypothetical protein
MTNIRNSNIILNIFTQDYVQPKWHISKFLEEKVTSLDARSLKKKGILLVAELKIAGPLGQIF